MKNLLFVSFNNIQQPNNESLLLQVLICPLVAKEVVKVTQHAAASAAFDQPP